MKQHDPDSRAGKVREDMLTLLRLDASLRTSPEKNLLSCESLRILVEKIQDAKERGCAFVVDGKRVSNEFLLQRIAVFVADYGSLPRIIYDTKSVLTLGHAVAKK